VAEWAVAGVRLRAAIVARTELSSVGKKEKGLGALGGDKARRGEGLEARAQARGDIGALQRFEGGCVVRMNSAVSDLN
jgi:hypothetical protein